MSNREEKQIEDLFKSTLLNSEINPDEQVWDRVLLGVNEKEKKRKVLFVWFVTINMLIIVLGILYNRWQIKMVSKNDAKNIHESHSPYSTPNFKKDKLSHIQVWNNAALKSNLDTNQSNDLNEARISNTKFNRHIYKTTINSKTIVKKAKEIVNDVLVKGKQTNFEMTNRLDLSNNEIQSITNTSLFHNEFDSKLKIQKFKFNIQYQLDTLGLIDLLVLQNRKINHDTVNQSKSKDSINRFKCQFGVSFNSQFFSQFSLFKGDDYLINQRKKSDQTGYGYSSNINLIYNFYKKFSMSFGVGIQSYLFKSERDNLKIDVNPVDSVKAISYNWNVSYFIIYKKDTSYFKQLYRNKYRNITVPLHLYYEFGNSNNNIQAVAHLGLEYHRLNFTSSQLKSSEYLTFGMYSKEDVVQYNLLRAQLGLGIENKISNRLFINVSPFVKVSLNNLHRNIPYQERPFFIGLQIGLKYYIKK
jgi:hypothetical protein